MTLFIALMLIYGFNLHWTLYVIAPMLWVCHLCMSGKKVVTIHRTNKSTR